MTEQEFDALVAVLERDNKQNTSAYRTKVILLALLGYVYIFAVLLLLLLLAIGILLLLFYARRAGGAAVQALVALGVFAFIIARALWVRLPTPEGLSLAKYAPKLHAEIEDIRKKLGGPRVHEVLLTDEFNAAIVQLPRFGLFGWPKNYLILGLPLMLALSPVQLRVVIAHEFGHLSGGDGRLGNWVYRVRKSWYLLMENLEAQQHWGAAIFRRFFAWYAPFFGAYSFVLARAQEYEADRMASTLTSTKDAADTLTRVATMAPVVHQVFWPEIYKQASERPEPIATPFHEQQRFFMQGVAPEVIQSLFHRVLHMPTSTADTHPSLSDRLAALGERATLPEPVEVSAAEELLGNDLPTLQTLLGQQWRQVVGRAWQQQFSKVQKQTQRLAELDAQTSFTNEERWEHATLVEELRGEAEALPLYQAIVDANPDHSGARFALGRVMLEQQDERGIAHLEQVMEREPNAVIPGCELIIEFLQSQGRYAEAQPYLQRGKEWVRILEQAHAERNTLRQSDPLLPHGLDTETVSAIKAQVLQDTEVRKVYLVRKQVKHFPERPLYVLGVEARRKVWYRARTAEDNRALQQRLIERNTTLKGEAYVVTLGSTNAKLTRRIKRVPNAEL